MASFQTEGKGIRRVSLRCAKVARSVFFSLSFVWTAKQFLASHGVDPGFAWVYL